MPAHVTDVQLKASAAFRDGQRFPVLAYFHEDTKVGCRTEQTYNQSRNKRFIYFIISDDVIQRYRCFPVFIVCLNDFKLAGVHIFFLSFSFSIWCKCQAFLLRTSQPLIGLQNKRSTDDETYLNSLVASSKGYIIDTRSQAAAVAAQNKGVLVRNSAKIFNFEGKKARNTPGRESMILVRDNKI